MSERTANVVIATVETRNFDWMAVASTETAARELLLEAWVRHCEQYIGASPTFMAQLIEDGEVTFRWVRAGMVLRDGEVVISK